VPGGIVRFKEEAQTRISEVARLELGATIRCAPSPILVREVMNPNRDVRGHFISMVYLCELTGAPAEQKRHGENAPANGQWRWHERCPADIIKQHEAYRQLIDRTPPLVGSGRN
jgi:ADP-ribose pyrophosphatase YjhB (NUDIX family)